MEMNLFGKAFVNSPIWSFFNSRFLMPLVFDNLLRNNYDKVLDLGCGIGHTTREIALKLNCREIFGVDCDEEQIKKAERANKLDNAKFFVDDGANLKFGDNYFDSVFAFNVMHHIKNYEKAIKEMHRVLKTNGDFYVVDASKSFFKNPVIKLMDNTQSFFSMSEFINKLKECGFHIQKYGKRLFFFYVIARKLNQ